MEQKQPPGEENPFSCHICLDIATEPVVTSCGHLFCWPCIYRWLETPGGNVCPVCKAGLTKETLVPIYGKGRQSDPRDTTPTPARPAGHRPEAEPNNHWEGPFIRHHGVDLFGSMFGRVHITTFGAGLEPINLGAPSRPLTPEERKQLFVKMLFFMGALLLAQILMI